LSSSIDEPCWAIGTGLVCPKEVAQDVCYFIRSVIQEKFDEDISEKVVIQYGGSVNVKNAKDLMEMPDIDGCLIGGASLNPEQFGLIVDYKNIHDGMFLPKL
jgi:triosephosphate isomerase